MYLDIQDLSVIYDRAVVLNGVSFHVDSNELVSLVGPNGAGKSTLLRAIVGLVKWEQDTLRGTVRGKISLMGSVKFNGEEITKTAAHEIVRKGLILCPERGRPFREMTVKENLVSGAYCYSDKKLVLEGLEKVYTLFPVLKARAKQVSGALSGGERTMLSIGRALMSRAKLLLIDEPSVGLAPMVKQDLFERIRAVHGMGITIFMTEQDVSFAFDLAMRSYVLSRGRVIAEGTGQKLLEDEFLRETYLGL